MALWVLGIAATGFGIWGCFQFFTRVVGTHITDCGFDANGAYAEVRINNLLGGAHQQEVWVDFYLDGRGFAYGGAYPRVPAHDRGRAVVRAPFPPGDDHVSGRTVYVDIYDGHDTFVTRKFAEAHPHRISTEVVPDASHTLSCGFDYTDPD